MQKQTIHARQLWGLLFCDILALIIAVYHTQRSNENLGKDQSTVAS